MLLATSTSPLLFLALLACPIGMGLMMVFMWRGMRGGGATHGPTTESDSVPELKAEQARLAEKIEALERARAQPDPEEKEPAATSRLS